jgi:hypothetical protein
MRSTRCALGRAQLIALTLLALSAPKLARAQLPSVDTRTFQPSTDPAASLSLEPVGVAPKWNFGAETFFHYSYRPVTIRRGDSDEVFKRPVEHVFGGDFVANLSLGSVAVGAALPYVFAQTGDKGLPPAVSANDRAPLVALGDVALEAKAPFIMYDTAGFALGMRGRVTLPSGDRTSFIGAGTTRVELRLLAEYNLIVLSAHASVGYLSRFDQVEWPAGSGVRIGDELPWSFGFRFRPKLVGADPGDRQLWELAARGSLPLTPAGPFGSGSPGSAVLSPVLLGVSDKIALGESRDLFVIAGVDVGLDGAVGVPAIRGIAGLGWMPREHDMDHDGVRDDLDQCPEIPEDRDGYEDDDGCPEIDDDDDGVVDKDDACPRIPGVEQPGPRNGCPAPDTDADGIPDMKDACPRKPGKPSQDPRLNGCPLEDQDGDGIPDALDKCPKAPEDRDGFMDTDGCPDEDDDADGIPDRVDACPREGGEPSSDPTRNGCPVRDRDSDAIDDSSDQCPEEPENYNGVTDDDGCPDKGGAPLVRVETAAGKTTLRVAKPIKLGGKPEQPEIDPTSVSTMRAIALELMRHRDFTATVGARPASTKDTDVASAQARATLVARSLRSLAHRDNAADVVAWDAVKNEPGAASGIAIGVVVAPAEAAPNLPTKGHTAPKP